MRGECVVNASLWSSLKDLWRASTSFPRECFPNQEGNEIFLSLTSAPYLIYPALVEIPKDKKVNKAQKDRNIESVP